MGLNTPAIIINDELYRLKDPEAGPAIARLVQGAGKGDSQYGVKTLQCSHSSSMQIVAVGGNTIRTIGYGDAADCDEALLRKMADRMGFTISKKRIRKIVE
jgi:hypothetical protein